MIPHRKSIFPKFLLITSCLILLSFYTFSDKERTFTKINKKSIGDKNLVECEFPKKWSVLGETDDQNPNFKIRSLNTGYDTIMYFLGKHYNNLYNEFKIDKKKEIKASFFKDIVKLKSTENNLKVDNAFFVKTIQNFNGNKFDLYRDGGAFNQYAASEDFKVLNYLALIVKDINGKIIDNKIIYSNCRNIIETEVSYFYLADDLSLVIKKFYTDETDHYFKGKEKYKLTKKGIESL